MFTTSLTAAVLSAMLASGSLDSPKWRTNYRDAASAATELRKPIAVFITTGSPVKLVKEGTLGKDAARLLRDGFVPLTVDTTTDAGKELAKTFNLSEGLVISDRTGGVQALRHAGAMTDADLKGYLERFAAPAAVATTEYRGAAVAPTMQPQYQAAQYQPQYVQYQPQYVQSRPVLNAIQSVGGFVQNVGGFLSGST